MVPQNLDLFVFKDAFLHRLGGAQLVTADQHRHLAAELGKVARLFAGGVATADHHQRLLPKDR
jgi:hypothetical protein